MENEVIRRDGFYISYNPCVFDTHKPETALVVPDAAAMFGSKFYILNGDWREQYNNKTLDECIEVFHSNVKYKGYSSD